jgi:hypothetical protein
MSFTSDRHYSRQRRSVKWLFVNLDQKIASACSAMGCSRNATSTGRRDRGSAGRAPRCRCSPTPLLRIPGESVWTLRQLHDREIKVMPTREGAEALHYLKVVVSRKYQLP